MLGHNDEETVNVGRESRRMQGQGLLGLASRHLRGGKLGKCNGAALGAVGLDCFQAYTSRAAPG